MIDANSTFATVIKISHIFLLTIFFINIIIHIWKSRHSAQSKDENWEHDVEKTRIFIVLDFTLKLSYILFTISFLYAWHLF